MKSFIDEYNAV